jgi:hypothetical protein
MIDVITYCPDPSLLVAEVAEKLPHYLTEDGEFCVDKVPVVHTSNGTATLCLVRCRDEEEIQLLSSLSSLEVLGTYDQVFADPALTAKYDSVYNRSPKTYTDEEGNEYTVTPPNRIGEFA